MNQFEIFKAAMTQIYKCGHAVGWVVGARCGRRMHRCDGEVLLFQTMWICMSADSPTAALDAVKDSEQAEGTSSMRLGGPFLQVFAFHKD
jgi:hypothetical protein